MMTSPFDKSTERQTQFRRALTVIETYIRALDQADANKETIAALKAVVVYLRGLREPTVNEILSTKRLATKKRRVASPKAEPDNAAITNMSLGDVEAVLRDQSASLSNLKRIAAVRFAFAPGALSRLSKERLIERLRDTMENEKTHETISRLAGHPSAGSSGNS